MGGDDRTFNVNFSDEGVSRLRERVTEKLKEFMGDYTDDTLVEYVMVLLRNGRHKEEAKNELDVFLGDNTDSFVSWIWDHLGSNLSLYVQPREPHSDHAPKRKSATGESDGRTKLHQSEFEAEKGSVHKTSRNRRSGEWKELVRESDENKDEATSLRSSIAANINAQGRPLDRTEQSLSTQRTTEKKRRLPEEQQDRKATVSAPRRLLQFAVRDAVAIYRPSTGEPLLKCLRSAVSTPAGDVPAERPRRTRQPAGLRKYISVAIKAAAEAVKDANKVRTSGSVFDRLGRHSHVSSPVNNQGEYGGFVEDRGEFGEGREDFQLANHPQNDSSRQQVTAMDSDMGYESYDGKGYDDVNEMRQGTVVISQSGTSRGNWMEDSSMFQYGAAVSADERVNRGHRELDKFAAMPSRSAKIASPINMNSWKPSKYQEVSEASEMDDHTLIQNSDTAASKSVKQSIMESNAPVVAANENAKPDTNLEKQSQTQTPTGIYSAGVPAEDADSRTIFVSNVHFAATKDSLSRHFNKFGEVLKVIILIDPSTGKPNGLAYIEFLRKEAAEIALSLDGTSFMSRILKIAWKSSAQPESASVVTWPLVSSPFGFPKVGRIPFARGIPNLYRARTPIKPGGRSFQWRRDAQLTVTETSGQASNSTVPTLTRSLTYVRPEPKTNESSGTA